VVYDLAARRLLLAHMLLVGAEVVLLVCAIWASRQPLLVTLKRSPPALMDLIRRLHIPGYAEVRRSPDQAAAQTHTYAVSTSGGG
jgi:hypothetical protein